MISFQKDTEGSMRLLKGVMRVGLLAKGEFEHTQAIYKYLVCLYFLF